VEVIAPLLLTLALVSGLLHATAALPLGKEPWYFFTYTAILRDSHDISVYKKIK
jgi:hypothetical protein